MTNSSEHIQADGPSLSLPHCVVIIPAHNEAEDIGFVIGEINKHSNFPVVVIDDASTDNTILVARKAGVVVVPLAVQLGAWGATQTGLRYALKNDYDYAITMDADGQHLAESLPALLQPLIDNEADVVIGTCTRRGSALRKIAWSVMKRISGLRLEDLTSGFRVYDRRAIRRLAAWQATLLEYQDVGVLAMLQAAGITIKDVEVEMLPRRHGISRVFYSWTSVIYYMSYTLLLSFTKRGMKHKN
ncbi:MAG: glycosyltransferase family 2 protein [Gammaproteobacteria bacterium]|nr:MAG: glycosyltransferase family 2 protein [Gammaproteobacteria bacterium]